MGYSSRVPRMSDDSSEQPALPSSDRYPRVESGRMYRADVGGRVPTAHESARLVRAVSSSGRLTVLDLVGSDGQAQKSDEPDVSDIPEAFKIEMADLLGYDPTPEEVRELYDNDPMKGEMPEEPDEKYLEETPWDIYMEGVKEREKEDGTAERRHEKMVESWTTGFVDNQNQDGEDDDAAEAEADAERIVHWSDSAKNGYDDDIEGTSGHLQSA